MTRASTRAKAKRSPLFWILPAVLPAAAAAWFLAQGPEKRSEMLRVVPEGAGERGLHAGLGLAVLVGLAWIVLPGVYWAQRGSRRGLLWCLERPWATRLALSPAMLVLSLVSLVSGALFAVNALAIVAAFLGTLLLLVWIVSPGLLGGREAFLDWLSALRISG